MDHEDDLRDPVLVKRAGPKGKRTAVTCLYRIDLEGVPVGMVALEFHPAPEGYEIWVLKNRRGKKIGRHAIEAIEEYLVSLGYAELAIKAVPVDPEFGPTEEALKAWYEKLGYTPHPTKDGWLLKELRH